MVEIVKTVGWLIRATLTRHALTDAEFLLRYSDKYGFSRSSYYRWKEDTIRGEDPPMKLMRALAELDHVHVWEMFRRLEDDTPTRIMQDTPIDLRSLRLFPLITGEYDNPHLKEAIRAGLEARTLFCYAADLTVSGRKFEWGVLKAHEAREERLEVYYRIHLLKIYEMMNELGKAKECYEAVQQRLEDLRREARTRQDAHLALLVRQLAVEAELCWLWADYWAAGVTQESVKKGQALQGELYECNPHRIPNFHHYMARCYVALGDYEEAISQINIADEFVFQLRKPEFARNELFLDAGGSFADGRIDYTWLEDEIKTAKTDILAAAKKYNLAIMTYCRVVNQWTPRSHINHHIWSDRGWQETLRQQSSITAEIDVKLAYTLEAFSNEIEQSGDRRIHASNVWAHGEYLLAEGNLPLAMAKFRNAINIAKTCSANDLYVRASLSLAWAALRVNDRLLAIDNARVVKDTLRRLDNPYLRSLLRALEEAIYQS